MPPLHIHKHSSSLSQTQKIVTRRFSVLLVVAGESRKCWTAGPQVGLVCELTRCNFNSRFGEVFAVG